MNKYTDTVFGLKDKAISIKEDCDKAINGLINRK